MDGRNTAVRPRGRNGTDEGPSPSRERKCAATSAPAACERRDVLEGAVGLGLGLTILGRTAGAQDDPAAARPQAGDQFVFATGKRKGEVVKIEDLPLGGPQALAWPYEPQGKVTRNKSRLSQVALVRLDPGALDPEMGKSAAEGVIAYSAVCTHQSCPVSQWKEETKMMVCSCHGSTFDPRKNAEVVVGPAKARLAALPLKSENGTVVAAGEFLGRVGIRTG
jgi:rieske iron-sulfur protein